MQVYHAFFQPLEWSVPHRENNACYCKLVVNKLDNVSLVKGQVVQVRSVHWYPPWLHCTTLTDTLYVFITCHPCLCVRTYMCTCVYSPYFPSHSTSSFPLPSHSTTSPLLLILPSIFLPLSLHRRESSASTWLGPVLGKWLKAMLLPSECEPQRMTSMPPLGSTPLCLRTSPHWTRPRALGKTPKTQVAEVKHPLTFDTPSCTHSVQQLEHTAADKQTEQWTSTGQRVLKWELPSRRTLSHRLSALTALHCTCTNLHCQHWFGKPPHDASSPAAQHHERTHTKEEEESGAEAPVHLCRFSIDIAHFLVGALCTALVYLRWRCISLNEAGRGRKQEEAKQRMMLTAHTHTMVSEMGRQERLWATTFSYVNMGGAL